MNGQPISVRAIRGAVQVSGTGAAESLAATRELIRSIMAVNALSAESVVSVLFTATTDLRAVFPAQAAREEGLTDVPLLCAAEIDVSGALPRVIRVLMHVETGLARTEMRHVYLGGAAVLRPDLAASA